MDKRCRSVLAIAMYSVRQRIVSPRVICLLIVMTVYIASRLSFVEEAVRITGLRTNPMIFTFITSDVICALIIFSGVVFLYADAPFIDRSQPYVIIRSNRFLWAAGQIIHVIAFSAVYFLALNLITAALLLPHGTLATDGWGKLINTLSLNDLGLGMYFDIPSSTVNLYSPLSAFLIAYIRTGADIVSRTTDIPPEFVSIIQGIIIVLVAAEMFLSGFKSRLIFNSAKKALAQKEGKA